jgi:DNA-binding GntR family transcriptional regulator
MRSFFRGEQTGGTRNLVKLERRVRIVNKNINNRVDNSVARPGFPIIILGQMTNTSPDANGNIVRDLEEDIVFGVFHPKEKLTEEGLMARFGRKRHVVRDALSELDSIGLVVRVPNRGAYVRELTPAEVIEIYEVREILEVAAAMRTPLPSPKEVVEAMKKIQDQHSEAIEHHDLRRVFRLNIQFHREQFLACGNHKLVQSIIEYAQQAHLIRAIKYSESGHLQKVERDHRQIIKAMQGKNRDSLVEIVRNHLPESRDAYVRAYALRHGSGFPDLRNETGD